ncbi:peptidoglycan-binding protein [Streptomyces sp. NRRL S-87]|uniref:peptidoglycan-binding domain-containing protein n=1 Tax=Streptomyces sp. NRRL S-87 TaxID=1463920 RepID=UPI0004C22AA2|nr:peptidoglycan-binding domain-containing protein [Streptomyces sp. NRRL S-87]
MPMNSLTRTAVLAGAATLALTALTGTAEARVGAPYIGYGQANNGSAVWCVQHQVNAFFKKSAPWHEQISEDSRFGPQTDEAIRFFQREVKRDLSPSMDVDGIVGPLTGTYLLILGDPVYGRDGNGEGYCEDYLPTYN